VSQFAGDVSLASSRSGRGNRGKGGGRRRKKRKNPEGYKKTAMLDVGRKDIFRYELRRILASAGMDEERVPSFVATVITRASRVSVDSAKEYVEEMVATGVCPEGAKEPIMRLLGRFTRYR